MTDLKKLLRIYPGEWRLVLVMGFVLLANAAAEQIAKVVSVSGFLSAGGVNQVLIIWAVDMALILFIAILQSLIIDRFERVTLMQGMIFGLALLYIVLRLLFTFHVNERIIYAVMLILVDQQWMFFPLIFWILANDIFDMAQAKRIFPLITIGALLGRILGLGFSFFSPVWFARLGINPEEVLNFNVLIYLLTYILLTWGLRNVKIRQTQVKPATARETLAEGWGFVRDVPAFRYLTIVTIAVCVTLAINRFRFMVVTNDTYATRDAYQRFYSLYQLIFILISFAVQSLLTSRIIEKGGLKNTFLIQPLIAFASTVWMIVQHGIVGTVGGLFIADLGMSTVDDSARKAFMSIVPEERRGRVSIFLSSYLPAAATIVGCLLTGIAILLAPLLEGVGDFYIYLGISLVFALVTVWASFRVRAVYDTSLFNWRLKRRQRVSSVMDKLDF